MIFAKNVIMIISVAIHKPFIRHDFVNKLFIIKMFLAERTPIFSVH